MTNWLPRFGALLMRLHGPSVQLHQKAHQRQPDAQTALGAVERIVDLREEVEDGCELLRGDADAVVAHAEDGLIARPGELEIDFSSVFGSTWRRCSAGWRGPGPCVPGRHSPATVPSVRTESSVCLRASITGRLISTALATIDRASTVSVRSWIFPPLMREISSKSSTSLTNWSTCREMISPAQSQVLVLDLEHLQHLDRAADRSERVSQFVGEHRQEFVLPAVVFLDVTIEPGILDGNRGAGGQVLSQRDVVGAEGCAGPSAGDGERTKRLTAHLERHGEDRAGSKLGPAASARAWIDAIGVDLKSPAAPRDRRDRRPRCETR